MAERKVYESSQTYGLAMNRTVRGMRDRYSTHAITKPITVIIRRYLACCDRYRPDLNRAEWELLGHIYMSLALPDETWDKDPKKILVDELQACVARGIDKCFEVKGLELTKIISELEYIEVIAIIERLYAYSKATDRRVFWDKELASPK